MGEVDEKRPSLEDVAAPLMDLEAVRAAWGRELVRPWAPEVRAARGGHVACDAVGTEVHEPRGADPH